jgi:hypothetical protein
MEDQGEIPDRRMKAANLTPEQREAVDTLWGVAGALNSIGHNVNSGMFDPKAAAPMVASLRKRLREAEQKLRAK